MDNNRQDLSQTRALCVDDPDVDDEDGGRTMGCGAVLEVAAAVADSAFGIGAPTQMLVTRPTCTGACTADESNRATVDIWASSGAVVRVGLDGRVETATAELIDPAAARWPTPTTTEAPAVARPGIAHAPARIRDREPYPFCGTFDRADPGGDDVPLERCFLDAVIDGRSAEYLAEEYGTEGGTVTELYRFAGSGSVQRDVRADGRWETQRGCLVLLLEGGGWSFEPFDE